MGLLKEHNTTGITKTIINPRKKWRKTYKIFTANQTKWRLDENYTITFTHKLSRKKSSFLIIRRPKPRRQFYDRCTIENCDFSADFLSDIDKNNSDSTRRYTHGQLSPERPNLNSLTYGAIISSHPLKLN